MVGKHPVSAAAPVALLRRVFGEQFDESGGSVSQKRAAVAGATVNPHDPEAQWSTKGALGKGGWHGYKAQVCETAEDGRCAKGEPTRSVITAIHVQPATASDHGSVPGVLAEHLSAAAADLAPPAEVFADRGCHMRRPVLLRLARRHRPPGLGGFAGQLLQPVDLGFERVAG